MSAARATIAMMVADTKNTTGLRGSLPGSLPIRAPGREPPGSRSTEKRSDDGAGRVESLEGPSGADSLSSLDSGDRLTDLLRSSWGLRGGLGCWPGVRRRGRRGRRLSEPGHIVGSL